MSLRAFEFDYYHVYSQFSNTRTYPENWYRGMYISTYISSFFVDWFLSVVGNNVRELRLVSNEALRRSRDISETRGLRFDIITTTGGQSQSNVLLLPLAKTRGGEKREEALLRVEA